MVLKKPYAFIIKHFRLIHLLMLGCVIYLLIVARDIHSLFASLRSTNTYIYAGAANFVNNSIFYIIFILLFLSIVVFWLLREKKKPTNLYLFLILYCIVQIVLFAYLFNLLGTIEEEVVEIDQLTLGSDLSNVSMLPDYVFIVICFIRGIGFNLKQFNFSKDIEELEIVDKDSAEFEVLIGQNNYKYMRFLRRTIREIKYYILENKFAISVFAGILLIFFIGYGIKYYNDYKKSLGEAEATTIDNITYTVNSSYITQYDYNGNTISDYYKYVVVNMTFYNSSSEAKALDLDKISLENGELVYYPTLTKNQKFYDLGIPYTDGEMIQAGSDITRTLAFEIPKSTKTTSFSLRVQYKLNNTETKITALYRRFDVNAQNIDEDTEEKVISLNETINTNVVNKNEFSITVTGYNIMDSYNSRYVSCTTVNSCSALSNVIKPYTLSTETMLVVDFNGDMYDDAIFTQTFNTYNKIFENFCTVKYSIYSKEYTTNASVVSNSDEAGKVFITMDRRLTNATSISLYFNFRNTRYVINLL